MWLFTARKKRSARSRFEPRQSDRLGLEVLEDRCLLSAGALGPTFGNGADYVTTSLTNSNDYGASTVIEPNGTLIVSGLTSTSGKEVRSAGQSA